MGQTVCFMRFCGKLQLAVFPTTQYFDVHAALYRTADVLGRPFDTGLLQSAWPLYSFFPRKPQISHICSFTSRLSRENVTLSDMGLDLDYGNLGCAPCGLVHAHQHSEKHTAYINMGHISYFVFQFRCRIIVGIYQIFGGKRHFHPQDA